jgi:PAS domain S-box-containing protein
LFDSWRRSAESGWIVVLLGALCLAALGFALFFRLPDADVLGDAGALELAAARLAAAAPAVDGSGKSQVRVRSEVGSRLAQLQASASRSDLAADELAVLRSRWAALPSAATSEQLQQLAAAAAAATNTIRSTLQARQQRTHSALLSAAAGAALGLLLAVYGLRRKRRRLRASMRQISGHLGTGAWQDAVQSLREGRLGSPSAFDALATGMEGALGESDRRWRALADLSADWYWETDAQNRLTWLSGSAPAVTMLGWTTAELMGKRHDELAFLEPPAEGWDSVHERMSRREPFRDLEHRARSRRDDLVVWVSISGRPRLDTRGRCVGYEGVGRNITERKSAQERLMASEQRWSLMAGLASDWYWETDEEHRIRPLAPELYRRVPKFAEKVVGRTRWEAYGNALTPEQWAEHRADLAARRPFRSLQFEAETTAGQYLWLSISGIPRFDGQGRFVGYHGVGRDITVRKQAERLLLRHNEALQRAVGERTLELQQLNIDLDAFSRQLAHELRTPISHVQGLAHLIEARAAGRLNDEERQLLALQVQAARHMRETVDALMLLARSTVQAMPMEPVDVSALAVQVLGELPLLERRAAVEWHVEPGLVGFGAPAALRIVLANLLGNAAKFTRHVARPEVHLRGRVDADGRLRVSLQDNGAGFDPAKAERLFQPFQRLHTGDDFHGTGIGLTIVQRIIERHGGKVSAEGAPGQGACFEFTLARDPRA